MKKLIIIPLLIVAISSFSQITLVSSKAVAGDHFWLPQGANEVSPIPMPDGADTVRSVITITPISSDSLKNVLSEIQLYNRAGTYMTSVYLPTSERIFNHTATVAILSKILVYIHGVRARFVFW